LSKSALLRNKRKNPKSIGSFLLFPFLLSTMNSTPAIGSAAAGHLSTTWGFLLPTITDGQILRQPTSFVK
jgi:hypothetical protein